MQATQDIFESTLFEVQNAFQFKLFELNFDPSPADLTRYNLELRKFTNLKFPGSEIISQDSKLFLITKKTNDCLTFPIFVEGQKIDLTIIEQKFTKKSWKILFDQIFLFLITIATQLPKLKKRNNPASTLRQVASVGVL